MEGQNCVAVIADEDQRAAARLAQILEMHKITPVLAVNFQQAAEQLASAKADLLFTEVEVPGGNGISLISAARRTRPQIASVIVTGKCPVETSIEALRHRVTDFLLKPASETMVASTLTRVRAHLKSPATQPAEAHEQPIIFHTLIDQAHERLAQPVISGSLRDAKLQMVFAALERCRGNKAAAAAALGISRRTLYRILDRQRPV